MSTVYLSMHNPADDGQRDLGDGLIVQTEPECVQRVCAQCGRSHDDVWTVRRVARASGLYWPFVMLNGARELLEGSLPNRVSRLPRDAQSLGDAQFVRVWHEDNESHVFGGPNVAASLRSAIAQHNASAAR